MRSVLTDGDRRGARYTAVVVLAAIVVALAFPASAFGREQSVEETYDATVAAYNQTLNQLEQCSLNFDTFQQFAKANRPADGAPKEEWDDWAKAYRLVAETFVGCMRSLKAKADVLKKKLDDLEKQLDSISLQDPPARDERDKNDKARKFLNRAKADLGEWKVGANYKIKLGVEMNRKAADDYGKHGSGSVKIEIRIQVSF
ncbi:MAG TPA: hypothetical protein VJH03_26585 [Blastocatellia bacterium]|nr:hypothetical protein [Blastocatellia bacterium]